VVKDKIKAPMELWRKEIVSAAVSKVTTGWMNTTSPLHCSQWRGLLLALKGSRDAEMRQATEDLNTIDTGTVSNSIYI
jgi:hypothetical protein